MGMPGAITYFGGRIIAGALYGLQIVKDSLDTRLQDAKIVFEKWIPISVETVSIELWDDDQQTKPNKRTRKGKLRFEKATNFNSIKIKLTKSLQEEIDTNFSYATN